MDQHRQLCEIIRTAVKYREMLAIAFSTTDISRELGGQAADELLNIQDIEASFVIFRHAGETQISARSLGKINVQLIMERLGGGGSLMGAGAQLGDKSVSDVADSLREAIENYFTLV
jgi:c-di-AMP phosphodiesterase-like protein